MLPRFRNKSALTANIISEMCPRSLTSLRCFSLSSSSRRSYNRSSFLQRAFFSSGLFPSTLSNFEAASDHSS